MVKKKDDKKTLTLMLVIGVVSLLLTIVIPIALYNKKNNDKYNEVLNKIETTEDGTEIPTSGEDDLQTSDERMMEEEVQQMQGSTATLDPFYPAIMKQIAAQKRNPFVVIPYEYSPSDNYLSSIFKDEKDVHVFKKYPIMVYVPSGPYFNPITQAFASYNYNFKGLFAFKAINSPYEADVTVVLADESFGSEVAKSTITRYDSDGNIDAAEIKISKYKLYGEDKISMSDVYNTTLHEIGHILGIRGHSQGYDDIMSSSSSGSSGGGYSSYYAGGDPYASGGYYGSSSGGESFGSLKTLSARDKETLKLMYSSREDLIAAQVRNMGDGNLASNLANAQSSGSADAYIEVADSYFYRKDYNKAIESYLDALKANPDNAKVYVKLAACYLEMRKYDDTIKYAKLALDKAYDNEEKSAANHYIAEAYEKRHDYSSALPYRYEAMNALPTDKSLFMTYLFSCHKLDKIIEAKEAYNKYGRNFNSAQFSEQEQLLVKWARQ